MNEENIKNEVENQELEQQVEVQAEENEAVEEVVAEVEDEQAHEEEEQANDVQDEEKDKEAEASEEEESKVEEENPTEEDKEEEKVEEESEEQEQEKEKTEDVEEESDEKPSAEDKMAALEAELAALKEEKAEREEAENVAKVEKEETVRLATVNKIIAEELEKHLKMYDIPMDKTLEELRAEDPTKAQLFEELVTFAQQVQVVEQQKSVQKLQDATLKMVFKKAEKLFSKFEMSDDQQDVAAQTFVNIMHNAGINDLGEDLKAKVELAVANAKFIHPDAVTTTVDAVEPVQEVAAVEVPVEVAAEEVPTEVEAPVEVAAEEVLTEEVTVAEVVEAVVEEPKIELDAFKEGVIGTQAGATGSAITEENVLEKMNKLPFRDRQAFYKEHADLINKACRKGFEKKRNI